MTDELKETVVDSVKPIFGYGSLILPPSVISRFDENLKEKLWELIQEEGYSEKFLELYTSNEAVQKWKKSDLHFVPVKVYGLERYYALESEGEGNKLVAEQSSEDSYINGVVILNLDKSQYEDISETEKAYKTLEKSEKQVESYIPDEKLQEKGIEMPENIEIFVATEKVEAVNKDTEEKRNPIYHQYIQKGIQLIAEEWFEDKEEQEKLQREFIEDFNKTTLEINDTGNWERLTDRDE